VGGEKGGNGNGCHEYAIKERNEYILNHKQYIETMNEYSNKKRQIEIRIWCVIVNSKVNNPFSPSSSFSPSNVYNYNQHFTVSHCLFFSLSLSLCRFCSRYVDLMRFNPIFHSLRLQYSSLLFCAYVPILCVLNIREIVGGDERMNE